MLDNLAANKLKAEWNKFVKLAVQLSKTYTGRMFMLENKLCVCVPGKCWNKSQLSSQFQKS